MEKIIMNNKMNKFKTIIIIFLCVVLFSCNFSKSKHARKIEDFYIDTKGLDIDQERAINSAFFSALLSTAFIALDTIPFDIDFNIYPRFFEKFTDRDIFVNLSQVHVVTYSGNDTTIVYDADDLAYFIECINYNKGEPIEDCWGNAGIITEEIGDLNLAIGPPLWDGINNLIYISSHLMRREKDGTFTHENFFHVFHIEELGTMIFFGKIPIVADWTNEWFGENNSE